MLKRMEQGMSESDNQVQLRDEYLDAELRKRDRYIEEVIRQRDLEWKKIDRREGCDVERRAKG